MKKTATLCAWLAVSILLAHGAIAASPQTEVFGVVPDPAVQREAQKLFEADWLRVKDALFAKSEDGKTVIQIVDLEINAFPFGTTTRADQLNGVEWKGYAQFKWAAHRFWLEGHGWTEWKDGALSERHLVRKKGAWQFTTPVSWASFFRGLDSKLSLQRPGPTVISAIEKSPTMSIELERSLLLYTAGNSVANADHSTSLRPTILSQVKPKYTEEARQNKIQGKVVLSVEFRADATIGDIRVVQGLGFGLDEKAIEAARLIRFRPSVQNGRPVAWRGKVEFSFNGI